MNTGKSVQILSNEVIRFFYIKKEQLKARIKKREKNQKITRYIYL